MPPNPFLKICPTDPDFYYSKSSTLKCLDFRKGKKKQKILNVEELDPAPIKKKKGKCGEGKNYNYNTKTKCNFQHICISFFYFTLAIQLYVVILLLKYIGHFEHFIWIIFSKIILLP